MTDFNVMIDLETLSQRKTAAIVSIGANKFTDKGIIDKFYINIDPISSKEAGLHVSGSTIEWWKTQKPEAFATLKNNRRSLHDALNAFSEWYGPKSKPTWSCGIDFDLVILENAYQSLGLQTPWKYTDGRCFRTFKNIFNHIQMPSDRGVLHNALDDANFQSEYIIKVMSSK